MLIELQSHSTVSDGQLPPAEVVEKAAEAGVTTLALTDHDAIAGVEDAQEAAEQLGIELVPAIEMSCVHEYAEDLHVCGYWIDLEKIAPACDRAQQERRNRAGEIVENLRREGFDLTLEDAIREAGARRLDRPAPHRPRRRRDRRPRPLLRGVPGARAPRPSSPAAGPPPRRRCELIRDSGGIAVVAHPYWDVKDPDQVEDLIRSLQARRSRDLLPEPQQGADRTPPRALRRARPRPHRQLRLPRPHPQDLRQVRRLRHLRPRRAAGAA